MDKEYEKKLVKRFIDKRIQDRLIFELSSSIRRKNAIWRFCHTYNDLFINQYMTPISKPNSDPMQILQVLRSYGAGDICYAISDNSEIDGKHVSLVAALEAAVGWGFPSIISCIPEQLLYFEAEQGYHAPPRFVIKETETFMV
jgi:hypothetical protein